MASRMSRSVINRTKRVVSIQKDFIQFCIEYPRDFEDDTVLVRAYLDKIRKDRIRPKILVSNSTESTEDSESSEESESPEEPPPKPKRKRGKPKYIPTPIHLDWVEKCMAKGMYQKDIQKKCGITLNKVRTCMAIIRERNYEKNNKGKEEA